VASSWFFLILLSNFLNILVSAVWSQSWLVMTENSFGGFSLLCTIQSSKHDQFQTNKAARYDTK